MRKTFYFFVIQVGVWYKQTDFLHWEISLLWKNRWLAWCDQKTKPFGSLHNRIKQLTDQFRQCKWWTEIAFGPRRKDFWPWQLQDHLGKNTILKTKSRDRRNIVLRAVWPDWASSKRNWQPIFLLKTKCMVTFEAFWKKICFKARTGVDTLGVFLTYLGCILFSRLVTLCMGYF